MPCAFAEATNRQIPLISSSSTSVIRDPRPFGAIWEWIRTMFTPTLARNRTCLATSSGGCLPILDPIAQNRTGWPSPSANPSPSGLRRTNPD